MQPSSKSGTSHFSREYSELSQVEAGGKSRRDNLNSFAHVTIAYFASLHSVSLILVECITSSTNATFFHTLTSSHLHLSLNIHPRILSHLPNIALVSVTIIAPSYACLTLVLQLRDGEDQG